MPAWLRLHHRHGFLLSETTLSPPLGSSLERYRSRRSRDEYAEPAKPSRGQVNWLPSRAAPRARARHSPGRAAARMAWSRPDQRVATLDDVKKGFAEVDFPANRIHYVVGKVEDTVPDQAPETIAILRLDTDWYESTRHELEHLYERLAPGGVLILDDYGMWQGSKDASWELGHRQTGALPALGVGRDH